MTEHFDYSTWPHWLRRLVPWLFGAVGVLVLLFAGVLLFLQSALTADALEERLNDALARSTDGQYRIVVGAVDWSLWQRSVRMSEVRIHPDSVSGPDATAARATSAEAHYRGQFASLELVGVHLWPLVWKGELAVNTVRLRQPALHVIRGEAKEGEEKDDQNDKPSIIATVQSALVNQLPGVWMRQLIVRDGTVVAAGEDSPPEAAAPTDSLWGVQLQAEEVRIDSSSQRDDSRILLSDRVQLSFDGYHHLSADRLYEMSVEGLQASSSDSSLSVESLSVGPTVSDAVFMQRQVHRTNRLAAFIGHADLQKIDYRQVLETDSFLVRHASFDSLKVDVYRNNQLPPPPTDPPPKMPHEIFRGMNETMQIDTITVTNGVARYTKWTEDSAAPGSISFDPIFATIYNVTNNPRRMSSSTPAVIQAKTKVAGEGWLKTTIRVPLLSPDFAVSYEGTLGPTDATAFNDAFVNISGLRINHGQVDSLWFSADAEHGEAHGTVHGLYRDLSLETLDKKTGKRGLRKRIGSFVLDRIVIKSNNTTAGPPLRTGTIQHEYEKGDTFLKFLWHSLRSGLFSLLK